MYRLTLQVQYLIFPWSSLQHLDALETVSVRGSLEHGFSWKHPQIHCSAKVYQHQTISNSRPKALVTTDGGKD